MTWPLGSKANPFTVAPADWHENGVPYGAYCLCSRCGLVEHSTLTFDYYADEPGEPLVCEQCNTGQNHAACKPLIDKACEGLEEEN